MTLVLSGTARVVRTGTAESSYRGPILPVTDGNHAPIPVPSNHANRKESFGFLLTLLPPVDNLGATGLLNVRVKLVGFAVAGARP